MCCLHGVVARNVLFKLQNSKFFAFSVPHQNISAVDARSNPVFSYQLGPGTDSELSVAAITKYTNSVETPALSYHRSFNLGLEWMITEWNKKQGEGEIAQTWYNLNVLRKIMARSCIASRSPSEKRSIHLKTSQTCDCQRVRFLTHRHDCFQSADWLTHAFRRDFS